MYRLLSLLLGLCLAAAMPLAGSTPSAADEKTSVFKMDIPAGEWKVAKFRGLPERGSLSLDVVSSGPVEILLFDMATYRRFPAIEDPLFKGKTAAKLGFSVVVPESGDYYLIIDNRTGDQRRKVSVQVKAATARHDRRNEAGRSRDMKDMKSVNAMLAGVAATLQSVFIADSLKMRTARCGDGVGGGDEVVICTEYAFRLLQNAPDKPSASATLMFSLFRQIGGAITAKSASDQRDPDRLDQLATVLMKMFGQDHRARTQAEYFASLAADPMLAGKLSMDRRYPMTVRRARNILRWLDDPELVRRWQPVLVPLMQTAFLERLRLHPTRWSVPDLVVKELAARGETGQPI